MPSVNSLTRNVGLRVGPIVLETLVKHYLEKIKRDFVQNHGSKEKDRDGTVQLRQDELIYDEIFVVVKASFIRSVACIFLISISRRSWRQQFCWSSSPLSERSI